MVDIQSILADNLNRVRERIARATENAGREMGSVQLVGVTKYVDTTVTSALLTAGCREVGESRPQQLWAKAAAPKLAGAHWHLIGHLQRNKVAATLPHVDLIHSVDSLRLLKAIDTSAQQQGKQARVLLEVNCSGDIEKHGMTENSLKALLPQLPEYKATEVCGLMTMAARGGSEQVATRNFATLRTLRDDVAAECPPEVKLTELSMGMSHDFEVAIHEGATIVRIGSLLVEGVV
ncbi:MAG: YggS family pyridoxal phosphate-dependent enzyme [Pirellulales bacterium]|nr:YggS family pyridoxal phosphate-dependent enzyme [Pirellulales bacterium]